MPAQKKISKQSIYFLFSTEENNVIPFLEAQG